MNALMELKAKCEALFLGWVAYRAGRNFYEIHPDVEAAFIHGAHALRRWWVWLFFFKVWLFSSAFFLWMHYLRLHDNATGPDQDFIINDSDHAMLVRRGLIFMVPALVAILITYCRNVDYSLFQRRFVYNVMKPLTVATSFLPNWTLYVLVPCMLCFPFPL